MVTPPPLIDPWRSIDKATAGRVENRYATKVNPGKGTDGGCMWALYDGTISGLYGEVWADDLRRAVYKTSLRPGKYNSVDLVMELLQDKGKAGDAWVFRFSGGKWQCETPDRLKGKSVEDAMRESVKILVPGWYFFGVSASAGLHSLVIVLEKAQVGVKLYWLDQFTTAFDQPRRKGYATSSTDVTNSLDHSIAAVGKNRTRVWPLFR